MSLGRDHLIENGQQLDLLLFFNLIPVGLYVVMRYAPLGDNDLKLISLGFVGLGLYLAVTAIAETRGLGAIVFPRFIMNPEFEEFFGDKIGYTIYYDKKISVDYLNVKYQSATDNNPPIVVITSPNVEAKRGFKIVKTKRKPFG